MAKTWAILLTLLAHPAWAMQIPSNIGGINLHGQTTVVVFLSARCPCSMSHEPTLKALAEEFKEAKFIGVHSNSDEDAQESASHFEAAHLPFPVIQDTAANLANQFGALKTPHVFVLNKEGKVIFQGGVDDSHNASRATQPFLKAALTSMRAGLTPEITQARSLGCIIRR
jgi:peroxiredoxin